MVHNMNTPIVSKLTTSATIETWPDKEPWQCTFDQVGPEEITPRIARTGEEDMIAPEVFGRESRTKSLKNSLTLLSAIVIPHQRYHHLSLGIWVRPVRGAARTGMHKTTRATRLVARV